MASLIKRDKVYVTNLRNVRDITTDATDIKNKRAYEHLCANKLQNLDKIDKFLEKHSTRRKENQKSYK